jgi:hypothetical protein
MTPVLSGKGSTFPAYGKRRTPSLGKGLVPWAAGRARGLRAPVRSLGSSTTRRSGDRHVDGQGLRLRSKPLASFSLGAPRYLRALQEPALAGRVAVLAGAAPPMPMRYNSALLTDAFHSALRAARGAAKRERYSA